MEIAESEITEICALLFVRVRADIERCEMIE